MRQDVLHIRELTERPKSQLGTIVHKLLPWRHHHHYTLWDHLNRINVIVVEIAAKSNTCLARMSSKLHGGIHGAMAPHPNQNHHSNQSRSSTASVLPRFCLASLPVEIWREEDLCNCDTFSDTRFFKQPKVVTRQCQQMLEQLKKRRSVRITRISRADVDANGNAQVLSSFHSIK